MDVWSCCMNLIFGLCVLVSAQLSVSGLWTIEYISPAAGICQDIVRAEYIDVRFDRDFNTEEYDDLGKVLHLTPARLQ